ncbi:hypothetical protein [Candidatus Aalborgicola defluviihabitans]|uniref:hypothetical protein n=1 Tax=Candidatus Aalborgicola defluviihabitans TaxID=3386187 RepID=UPI00390A8264|nr:hypothetical protein [Burkholderiales bacterium]
MSLDKRRLDASVTSSQAANELGRKLSSLFAQLSPEEAANLKTILSLAAGGIGARPARPQQSSLRTIATALTRTPVLHREYIVALTQDDLESLQMEALRGQSSAHRNNDCWLLQSGPIAQHTVYTINGHSLLRDLTPRLAMYTYYRNQGDQLNLHVDDPQSELSAVLMISHKEGNGGKTSCLIAVTPEGAVNKVYLAEGEMLIFTGSSTLHGRLPVGEAEEVTILAMTFGKGK